MFHPTPFCVADVATNTMSHYATGVSNGAYWGTCSFFVLFVGLVTGG